MDDQPYLTAQEIQCVADLVGASPATARRWRAAHHLPRQLTQVGALATGHLGALDPAWRGWRLAQGVIWSPAHFPWRTLDLASYQLALQRLRELERETAPGTQRRLDLS